jgi:23S rRNA pseudouridine2605 synthase
MTKLSKDRVTLDRALSKFGFCSRTEAVRYIRSGDVSVNDQSVRDPETWVSLEQDQIRHLGHLIKHRTNIYLALYKPKGYVTSYGDPDGRPTVYDLLHGLEEWVFPVGRLDLDTTGLLLMTNDADFSERLTNPSNKISKTYLVKIKGLLSAESLQQLRDGIRLKNQEKTRPARVRILKEKTNTSQLEITIYEGKNRQVRRMIEAAGGKVLKLVRTRIGNLTLEGLEIGKWRFLQKKEVAQLMKCQTGRGFPGLCPPGMADN